MICDKFIHMGSAHFDEYRFIPIKNDVDWVKPRGGLWASPENAPLRWEDWVEENEFSCNLDDWFMFELKSNARVLEITNAKQLDALPKGITRLPHSWVVLDFEAIAKEYDAMLVMISNDQRLYWDLYGWDCDTLLVFNPRIIKEIMSSENKE